MVKLTRTLTIIPTVITFAFIQLNIKRKEAHANQKDGKFLMVCALAAIGLNTSFSSMKNAGIRPMIQGVIISALVVIVALLVEMAMGIV